MEPRLTNDNFKQVIAYRRYVRDCEEKNMSPLSYSKWLLEEAKAVIESFAN